MQATLAPANEAATDLPVFQDATSWYGREMAKRNDWIHQLDAEDVAEIDAAIAQAMAGNVDLVKLAAADFPLPRLGERLRLIRKDVLHGHAFALLRGWPSGERGLEQSAYAFRGIAAHLGDEALAQNGKGHVLGHVANLGMDYSDPMTRGYQTTAELRYHVDAGDIVGLLCVRPSRSGGASKLASATTVWNELVRRRPDLARALTEPVAYSRWGEIGAGQKRYFELAPFQFSGGRVVCVCIAGAIHKAQAFEEVKRLSQAQIEALLVVNAIADEPQIRLEMDFRSGDMQFLCNHFTLHSRTSYEDWPEAEQRRHLLRVWLACNDGPQVPDSLTKEWQGSTSRGRPAGINVPGVARVAPLQAV
jgi:hypothetical protein